MKNKKLPQKSPEQKRKITKSEASKIIAEALTCPTMAALRVIMASDGLMTGDALSHPDLRETLHAQSLAVNQGDLSQAEAILINQAIALQTLFARLAERAMKQEYIQQFDVNMKMALRAQSQCRATLETLASIKNPPVVYARQANIAHGHQQVNNGIPVNTGQDTSHAREEKTIQTNELLEVSDGKGLDIGTKEASGGTDPAMAAVETINRAENRSRKKNIGT